MCNTPIIIKVERTGENQSVPCGACPRCISRRISGWSFRLMQEDKYSESSYFITLTYDSEHVPITDNGFLSLKISDVQDFFKAIRKLHDKQYHIVSDFRKTGPNCNAKPERPSIKYYTAGEYGTKGRRPHYHSIVFNLDLKLITDHADHLLLKHTKFDGITEIVSKAGHMAMQLSVWYQVPLSVIRLNTCANPNGDQCTKTTTGYQNAH